jgi:urease accessory protein UreF
VSNLSTVAFLSYLSKVGVPEHYVVGMEPFGGNFLELQKQLCAQFGVTSSVCKESKAHAARGICEELIQSIKELNPTSNDELNAFLATIECVSVTSVAVAAYALKQDLSKAQHDSIDSVATSIRSHAQRLGMSQSELNSILNTIKSECTKAASVSLALGQRKGFFSRLFG